MTKTQAVIIDMIGKGFRNTEIVQATGKTPDYVSRIRRRLTESPEIFERASSRKPTKMKIPASPKGPKYNPDRVECLRCGRMFDSYDRRYNRICPRCTGERDHNVDVLGQRAWNHRTGSHAQYGVNR
jgi:hypothetical protein